MALNQISLMGRLTKDVELRRTQSGTAVANFTLAVDRDFGHDKKTDFINCIAWGKTGEFVQKYFAKGRMMAASGRLEIRDWTDKEGKRHTVSEVNVQNAYFGDSKPKEQNKEPDWVAEAEAAPQVPDFPDMDEIDEQLPF